jgi:hypothetical protein
VAIAGRWPTPKGSPKQTQLEKKARQRKKKRKQRSATDECERIDASSAARTSARRSAAIGNVSLDMDERLRFLSLLDSQYWPSAAHSLGCKALLPGVPGHHGALSQTVS